MYSLAALLLAATALLPHPPVPAVTRIAYETASGGRLGGFSSLVVTPDSTIYVEGTRAGRQTVRAKTAKATWQALTKSLSMPALRQLKSSPGHQAYDGTDVTVTVTQGREKVARVNPEDDAPHYQAVQPLVQLLSAQQASFAARIQH